MCRLCPPTKTPSTPSVQVFVTDSKLAAHNQRPTQNVFVKTDYVRFSQENMLLYKKILKSTPPYALRQGIFVALFPTAVV